MANNKSKHDHLSYILSKLERETGLNFAGSDFNSRLRIQKSVYLLKVLDVPPFTGYDFGYYIRGPYSPSLAKDYYSIVGKFEILTDANIPFDKERIVIEAANRGNRFLEAVATLHFAWTINGRPDRETVLKIVKELKPSLNDKLPEAWQFLVENGLLN